MVKILGVVCSMRPNGNTEKLVKHALNVAAEKGAETELLLLREKKIEYCDSDFSCVKSGNCRIQDGMQEVYPKLAEADGIILGSPVHFGDVCGLAKTFIDRTVGYVYTQKLKGKVGGAVVVARRRGKEKAATTINHFFLRHGMVVAGLGAMGFGYMGKDEIEKDELASKEATALVEQMTTMISTLSGKGFEGYKITPFSLDEDAD